MQCSVAGHCPVFSASVCQKWEKSVEDLGADASPPSVLDKRKRQVLKQTEA